MLPAFVGLLVENPLLLFFLVASVGYLLGEVRLPGGLRLGLAAVLFTGLAAGAVDPRLKIPDFAYHFGLVLFVYNVGLASGPSFFASMKRQGLRLNGLALGVLLLAAGTAAGVGRALGLAPAVYAGLFTGAMTNTPALANLLERLEHAGEAVLAQPVVGYSVAYPGGVVGGLLAIFLAQRLWRVDYRAEAVGLRDLAGSREPLSRGTVRVLWTNPEGATVADLVRDKGWRVVFGRYRHGGDVRIAAADTAFAPGDVVTVTGTPAEVDAVAAFLGEPSDDPLAADRRDYDVRRVFVSNPDVAGRPLRDLHLQARFDAVATRVRRGDVDLVPDGATVLEVGDRVRVLVPRARMDEVSRYFGDSYRGVSEFDVVSFGLGIALGLLLGAVPFPLPDGGSFRLGFAGGPLVVGLILGRVGRTGPILWNVPFAANLALRQLGIVLFLAAVGVRSGWAFVETFGAAGGLALLGAGAAVTCGAALVTLLVGYKVLGVPMGVLIGVLAGIQTQPAVLSFAAEQADNDLPAVGYATVYPASTLAKILLAQLLLSGP